MCSNNYDIMNAASFECYVKFHWNILDANFFPISAFQLLFINAAVFNHYPYKQQ